MLEDGKEAIIAVEPDPEPVRPSEASRGRYSRKGEKKRKKLVGERETGCLSVVSEHSPIASGSV
jgi:hypothetical protein